MWWTKRALWGLTCVFSLWVVEVQAGTYTARLRWQPSSDPTVAGYRVYSRLASGSFGPAQDAGKPAPAPDGTVSFQLTNLNVESDYAFAVSVYATGGSESPRSNERTLVYGQVASLVDSDDDGLTDAQEDVNLNRVVDAGESNPDVADSDADGIGDAPDTCEGTAGGAAVNGQGCSCAQIAPCGDGNACNGAETCTAGVCQPGSAPNCNDGDACTNDSCNPVLGCVNAAITGCSTCTLNSQCNDGSSCTTDSCTNGMCQYSPQPNGTACGDGNACNGAEVCQSGVCSPGAAPTCNDNNPCTTDSCNASSGCVYTTKANGASCSDGNACNGAESCQGGACTAGTPLTCNDNNPCTSDSCTGASGCVFSNKATGSSCSDGNQCNGGETCQDGSCRPGTPLTCNDNNSCTTDTCNAATGCVYSPTEGCSGCTTSADCNDGNPCTADSCTGGTCVNTTRADGTTCSDGLYCTVGETCVAGTCGGGGPNCVAYETPCKNARCDEERRACVTEPLANGTACGSADTCTAPSTCQYGSCVESAGSPCDDGNPCTADACDPAGGCTHAPVTDGTSCADRNFCDGAETCQAGTCVEATAPQCDDGNSCTEDLCDWRKKRCAHTAAAACCSSDAQCADDDLCTTNERCSRGQCISDPVVCPRGGRCDLTSCDPTLGCQLTPLPDGTTCEDGDPCTRGETCRGGTCVLPPSALGAATTPGGQALVVEKFVLKPLGKRGTRLSARGSFTAASAPDPTQGDVAIEVRDPEGYVVYAATVPGAEFVADRGGTRLLYWVQKDEAAVHNGLQKLLLVLNGESVDIVAKGVIPPGPAPLTTPHAAVKAGKPSPTTLDEPQLAWAVNLFDGCWSDPDLWCKRWRRYLTWCR